MDLKRDLLLRSAARLYSLGMDLENAKERIRQLAKAGVEYSAPEMAEAAAEYTELKAQWEALEQEYLDLKQEIVRESTER